MKSHLRNHIAAAFLLAPVALAVSALPATALAQSASPEVRSLEVNSDFGIKPGSRLRLRLEGTPRAQASVRIRGVQSPIALREVEPGIYVGRYVITRNDRIEEGAPIRAMLRSGNRTSTASYNVPEGLGGAVAGGPPPNQPPPPPQLRIERFTAAPVDRLEPGAELRFMVEAAPGARGWVDLPGIRNDVALNEVRPGVYEGAYTLRRSDNFAVNGPVVANLRYGDRVITAELQRPLAAAPMGLPIEVTSHPNNGVIEGNVARVRGHTAPYANVQVRVQAVPPVIGQFGVAQQVFAQTVQADRDGNFEFTFTSPIHMPGTRYDVSLIANKADITREARIVLFQRQG